MTPPYSGLSRLKFQHPPPPFKKNPIKKYICLASSRFVLTISSTCGDLAANSLNGEEMIIDYTPQGVCARRMIFEVENGIVISAQTIGGCPGNSQGVSKLITGMKVDDIIHRLEGIKCGNKSTSCPDQIAQALKQAL